MVATSLERFSVRVVEAADTAAAVAELRREAVRLLFVDLQLPDRGAEQLIALARMRCPEYSLVVMTRRPSLESAVEAVRTAAAITWSSR